MRKTRVIGFVVASLVSAASLAQAQNASPNARQERRAEARGIEGRAGHEGRGGLLRGITLSVRYERAMARAFGAQLPAQGPLAHAEPSSAVSG